MNIQYFFVYLLGDGWGIGTSPNMLVNWYAKKSSNMITFPIGMNVSKVVKIGILLVKFQVKGQYMPGPSRRVRSEMGHPVRDHAGDRRARKRNSIRGIGPYSSGAKNDELDSFGANSASII